MSDSMETGKHRADSCGKSKDFEKSGKERAFSPSCDWRIVSTDTASTSPALR